MTPAEKSEAIKLLKDKFSQYSNFYVTNTESLSVAQFNKIRRACFDKEVEMRVAKNTLIKRALESIDNEKYSGLYDSLKGVTALMFSDSPKNPAVIISSFRIAEKGNKPILKAAFVADEIYMGDNQLAILKEIKTKDELIGEVINLLQSPISRVLSALEQKESNSGEKENDKEEATEEPKTEEVTTEDQAKPEGE